MIRNRINRRALVFIADAEQELIFLKTYLEPDPTIHVISFSFPIRQRLSKLNFSVSSGEEVYPVEDLENFDHSTHVLAKKMSSLLWKKNSEVGSSGEDSLIYYIYNTLGTLRLSSKMASRLLEYYSPTEVINIGNQSFPKTWRQFCYRWQPTGEALLSAAKTRGLKIQTIVGPKKVDSETRGLNWRYWIKYRVRQGWRMSINRFRARSWKRPSSKKRILILCCVHHMINYTKPAVEILKKKGYEVCFASYLDKNEFQGCPHFMFPIDYMATSFSPPLLRKTSQDKLRECDELIRSAGLTIDAKPIFDWLNSSYVPYLVWLKETITHLVKDLNPDVVLSTASVLPAEIFVLSEADALGIPTFVMQHGAPLLQPWISAVGSDNVIVWTASDKEKMSLLERTEKKHVTVLEMDMAIPDNKPRLPPNTGRPRLLVLGDTSAEVINYYNFAGALGLMYRIAEIGHRFKDITIVLRPHPSTPIEQYYPVGEFPFTTNIEFDRRKIKHIEMAEFLLGFDYVLGDTCHPYELALSTGTPTAFLGWGLHKELTNNERGRAHFVVEDEASLIDFFEMIQKNPHPPKNSYPKAVEINAATDRLAQLLIDSTAS